MKLERGVTFLAACGLTAAAILPHVKRWDYDVCHNDCSLSGVAMPDQDTFRLPLESFWSEQCPQIIAGNPRAPVAFSKVCCTFAGTALQFTFAPFSGYNFKSAFVTWTPMGSLGTSPRTTKTECLAGPGGTKICSVQFTSILGVSKSTSIKHLMAGMCPNGDREGLDLSLQFSGALKPKAGGSDINFVQQFPCTTRAADRSCTAWDTSCHHIEVAYRCTNCNNPCHSNSCTPSTVTVTTTTTTTTTSPTTTTTTTSSESTTTTTVTTTSPTTTTTTTTSPTTTTTTTSSESTTTTTTTTTSPTTT
ncbi:hypothetical protein C8A05DRAFT_18618, partial [Staphylotrichum tortipilum]